jgi:hypothetical protein
MLVAKLPKIELLPLLPPVCCPTPEAPAPIVTESDNPVLAVDVPDI